MMCLNVVFLRHCEERKRRGNPDYRLSSAEDSARWIAAASGLAMTIVLEHKPQQTSREAQLSTRIEEE